jgi:uncharacterized protein YPO0396
MPDDDQSESLLLSRSRSVARLADTASKLDAATKAADEAERQVKVLSNSSENDGDRVAGLERALKAAKVGARRGDLQALD